jgi:L-seryl-tRNA(Ser) seleniumtransferase
MSKTIYHRLGTKPVINASGVYTDLGGSVLSPKVWAAVEEANGRFADMVELLDRSGEAIAEMLGAEAARVTPGASAAIALGAAACLTGKDGEKMERLPDTTGMKDEVVIQRKHRYKYDRCVRMTGAHLVEAGDGDGTTLGQLEGAIGDGTAAICFPAHLDRTDGTVSLAETTALAKRRGVPTLVDAAYLNFPPEKMGSFTAGGADLVCFSAKYFGGPNAGGFICGDEDLIEAVAGVDFTCFESGQYKTFGRPFKLDRQTVVAVVVALQEWLTMDHDARFEGYSRKVQTILRGLKGVPSVDLAPMHFTMQETLEPEPVNCLVLRPDSKSAKTVSQIDEALRVGDPAIYAIAEEDYLVVVVDTMLDGQEDLVAERLRSALTS